MSKQVKAKITIDREELDEPAESGFTIPPNPADLARFVRTEMGAEVAASALIEGSDGPLAYLVHSFFEGRFAFKTDGTWEDCDKTKAPRPPGDCVVWANRGGGKTFLGAVATALDMIFKPKIEIRILGGSAEQSRRMHEHLRKIFEHERLEHLLEGRTTENRIRLNNGSRVEILSHSERSVRGVRVQKLRCDEVDLFDKELWEAAQLVTRSTSPIPGPWGNEVRGVIEVLSTMHVPMGMMWNIVKETGRIGEWTAPAPSPGSLEEGGDEGVLNDDDVANTKARPYAPRRAEGGLLPQSGEKVGMAAPSRVLFKWGVIDALEKCGPEHTCEGCALHEECRGLAKKRQTSGHMTIRDALTLKRRVSRAKWETEMLCREPSRSGCVYAEFSPAVHVEARDVTAEEVIDGGGRVVAGMDFGVRAPSVVVWGYLARDGTLVVIDEYGQAGRRLGEHVAEIKARPWGEPVWIGIDPAGAARNEQTGTSNLNAMRNAGLKVRAQRTPVLAGIESVRSRLSPAQGPPRLKIAPRCRELIDSLSRYHFPVDKPLEPLPEKDGSDHWCDALRYLVVNLEGKGVGIGHT